MGVLSCVKQVVFVVDTSSALSGIFNMLLANYIVPCVEHFNGGPIENADFTQSPSTNQYGLVTINPSPLFSVPSCDYWPITDSSKTLLNYFRNVKFEGGLIEHCCRISDGLAAAMEFLDLMGKFAQKSDQSDVQFEKYCVLVTNLPPSPMTVVESLKFGGMTHLQLGEHMANNEIKLSIISPRWLSPYKELFLKGSQSADITNSDHGLHSGCMVLFHGFELSSIKSLKAKNDPNTNSSTASVPVPTATGIITTGTDTLVAPSPLSTSQPTPGSVPAQFTNTPSPSQLPEPQTSTLPVDKIPLTKASSSSSLPESYSWLHSNSPKVISNPASVPVTSFTQGIGDVPSLPISHTPSPQSVMSPQRSVVTTSLHQATSASQSFPLQSINTSSTSFSGSLTLTAHDPLGSMSNPIQITSPGADSGLVFPSSTVSSHGPSSLISPPSSSLSTVPPSTVPPMSSASITSPPFTLSSSMTSQMEISNPLDSTVSAPPPAPPSSTSSTISSLLMANTSIAMSSQSAGIRPPLSSQAPTPPPPHISTSQPQQQQQPPPQGPAAIAAQILLQATQQANNNKPPPLPPALSVPQQQPQPGGNLPPAPNAPNPSTEGYLQPSTTSLTSSISQPPGGGGANTAVLGMGGGAPGTGIHNQMNPPQLPMQQQQQQQQQQQPLQQTQIWSGTLETFELRNNIRHPRPVQCSIHVSKPDIAQEIKPETWPTKLTMNTYSKNLFNTFTAFFRNHQSHLRTVHFQFMERPENVMMLRSLMNNDLPQNKKIGIVQLSSGLPLCPIKAFFIICQEKQQSKQFTGLIPLDQEKFISTLRQALTVQPRPPQPMQQIQRAGHPSNLMSNNMMNQQQQQQMAQQQQQQQSGMGTGGQVPQTAAQQQVMTGGGGAAVGSNTGGSMEGQNTFNTGAQGAGGGGGVASNNAMFMGGQQQQQQNYSAMSSMMGSQSNTIPPTQQQQQQQQHYSGMTGGSGGGGPQQPMLQQQLRSNLQQLGQQQQPMGGGQQQSMGGGGQQQPNMGPGGQQQMGGQMGGQQQSMMTPQQIKQALENATPEKRQMIFAKLEQTRAMRLQQQQHYQQQQQQQQQQQGQMYGGGGGATMQQQQHLQQANNPGQQPMGHPSLHGAQQPMTATGGGGMQQPQQQQQQGLPGSNTQQQQQIPQQQQPPGGGGSGQGTLDFFNNII